MKTIIIIKKKIYSFILLFIILNIFSGCSPNIKSNMSIVPKNFIDGTIVLAAATDGYTRQSIVEESIDKEFIAGWYKKLLSSGVNDSEIVDGSEIGAMTYLESMEGIERSSFYLAHIPKNYQGKVHEGDIIEVELRSTKSNELIGLVINIFRKYDNWGDCYWNKWHYGGTILPSNLNAAWLDCKDIEKYGWEKVEVAAGGPSYEWHKIPSSNKQKN